MLVSGVVVVVVLLRKKLGFKVELGLGHPLHL